MLPSLWNWNIPTFIGITTFLHLFPLCMSYYRKITCFGTGDCIGLIQFNGHIDDQHRWANECSDGEALVGFMDFGEYTGFSEMWCKFMFPRKPPKLGIYPFYEYCNVRDIRRMKEFYCYDKYYPADTYDTFVTAFMPGAAYLEGIFHDEHFKCCKLPFGYHIDYTRCQYKYTHDKMGEHYNENSMFVAKCDRDHVMTGIGQALSPVDEMQHFVWIQCCPLFYDPSYVTMVHLMATGNYSAVTNQTTSTKGIPKSKPLTTPKRILAPSGKKTAPKEENLRNNTRSKGPQKLHLLRNPHR